MDAPQAAIETGRGKRPPKRNGAHYVHSHHREKKKKSRMLLVTELINAGLEMDKKGCLGLSARSQFITSDYIQ